MKKPEAASAPYSRLVELASQHDDLVRRIADIEKHNEAEQKILEQVREEHKRIQIRVDEVFQMNYRTKKVRLVELQNVKQQIENIVGNSNDCNQAAPTLS